MRCLGLDLGSKTLGLAISDRTSTIATSLEVLRYNDYDELLDKLSKIVESRKVDSFVLGNPLNLDGSISKRSEITFEFKKLLEEKFRKEVIMQDERVSTVEAERILLDYDMSRKKRKEHIDNTAAAIILDTYLRREEKK